MIFISLCCLVTVRLIQRFRIAAERGMREKIGEDLISEDGLETNFSRWTRNKGLTQVKIFRWIKFYISIFNDVENHYYK